MHASAYNDRVECMELLEQHEGNVNAVDDDGYTPLMIAAERGHDRAMGMFPDVYNRGKTTGCYCRKSQYLLREYFRAE